MYTPHGVRWSSAMKDSTTGKFRSGVIPWDSVKPIRYKNPIGPHKTAVRHTLEIRPEHFGGEHGTPNTLGAGLGSGGLSAKRSDIGRTLVVDLLPDGRLIDSLNSMEKIGDRSSSLYPVKEMFEGSSCEGCDKPLNPVEASRWSVCMDCTRARHRAACNRGTCTCGRKKNPGEQVSVGSRVWTPCRRCLGAIHENLQENFGAIYHHYYAMPATGGSAQRPWSRQDYRDYYDEGAQDDLDELIGTELAKAIRDVHASEKSLLGEGEVINARARFGRRSEPQMEPYSSSADWTLVHMPTGKEIKPGAIHKDFRGDTHEVRGGTPPHKPESTGRVTLRDPANGCEHDYYPGVIDAEWRRRGAHRPKGRG